VYREVLQAARDYAELAMPPETVQQHPQRLSVGRVSRKIEKVLREMKRRRLRRRVALTPPSPHANQDVPFSPHCLTCHDDLLMAICSAKSLNLAIEKPLPWIFHDDGSLTGADKELLRLHFPGCRVIDRAEADDRFRDGTEEYFPLLDRGRRKSPPLLLKLADVHVFARRDRILYVDSDILFFKRPDNLMEVLENAPGNYSTKDIATAYTAKPEILEELTGVRPLDRVNSGILVLNRAEIALGKIAAALTAIDLVEQERVTHHDHLIEQTLVAILMTSGASGAAHLPPEYDLYLEKGLQGDVCRHYVGGIRHLFELEGLRTLLVDLNFETRWRRFATPSKRAL
jgi:hypothetical protein